MVIERTNYHIRGEHDNNDTTDVGFPVWVN